MQGVAFVTTYTYYILKVIYIFIPYFNFKIYFKK